MDNLISELTMRSLGSINFIIKTKAIHELEDQISSWNSASTCGAIIYGRARIGKTRAMMSTSASIKEKYGEDFPVIAWDITDHAVTEKNFYMTLLMAIGLKNISPRSTALELKARVLNELTMAAYATQFKKIVLMIDEAGKLDEKDFFWLMDLYNNLNHEDICLTVFLFGTKELKDIKKLFKKRGQDQIVGRFMINEFQFYGMKDMKELKLCLMALDNKTIESLDDEEKTLLKDYYFPDSDGKKFSSLAPAYWEAFMQVRNTNNIVAKDIPMKYFIDSFILLLQKYGAFSKDKVAFPTYEELLFCVKKSGYGESDDEYTKSKCS